MSVETERLYKRILECDEDLIRIFWGDIIKNADIDDDGTVVIEELNSISTQSQKLLTINNAFIDSAYVRRAVAKMINKKLKLLAAGKFYIKGDYKTLTQCPLTYMDWIMNRVDEKLIVSQNGLKADEFYCSDINQKFSFRISKPYAYQCFRHIKIMSQIRWVFGMVFSNR